MEREYIGRCSEDKEAGVSRPDEDQEGGTAVSGWCLALSTSSDIQLYSVGRSTEPYSCDSRHKGGACTLNGEGGLSAARVALAALQCSGDGISAAIAVLGKSRPGAPLHSSFHFHRLLCKHSFL